jgi:hypothetical protein
MSGKGGYTGYRTHRDPVSCRDCDTTIFLAPPTFVPQTEHTHSLRGGTRHVLAARPSQDEAKEGARTSPLASPQAWAWAWQGLGRCTFPPWPGAGLTCTYMRNLRSQNLTQLYAALTSHVDTLSFSAL